MAKTIKQIADEIGVSKQAVHQKRKSKALSTALQPFTTTVDGIVYISVDGEKLIKQAFAREDRKQECKQIDGSFTPETVLYDMLKRELEIKNKQIKELNERLVESQKLINRQQHLNAIAEQKIKLIEDKEVEFMEVEKQKKWYEFWR